MKRVQGDTEDWTTGRWRTQERIQGIKIPRGGVNDIAYQ